MTRIVATLFTAHPQTVGETYFEHMRFAGWFCGRLAMAAFAAGVHAILPFLFEKTAGKMIREKAVRMESRH